MSTTRRLLFGFLPVVALLGASCGSDDGDDEGGGGVPTTTAEVSATTAGDGEGGITTAAGEVSAGSTEASGGGAEGEGEGEAASGEPILVGAVHDLSGAVGPYGVEMLKGAELAVAQFNEAGGLDGRPVELVAEDLASDRALIASAVQKLAGEGVVAIHGPTSSTALVVGAPVAQSEGLVMIPPGSVDQFDEGVLNEWIYRIAPVTAVALPDVMEDMQAASPFTQLAVFYDPANNASVNDLALLEGLADDGAFEIVAVETAEEGATDFSSQISNISASGAEAIWVSHLVEENAAFMVQARERGIEAQFIGGATFTNAQIFELAGEAGEGAITYVPFVASSSRTETADFVAAFTEAEGNEPDVFAAQGYDAMLAILNGMESAGSADAAAIRDAMEALTFEGATATITYDGPGDNTTPNVVLVRVEDGTFVPVEG